MQGSPPVFLHETESAQAVLGVTSPRPGRSRAQRACAWSAERPGNCCGPSPSSCPARLVPQATQSASLVSVNKAAHGFGLQEQLVHTPICARCGLAAMSALESLLSDQWKNTLAGQDTRLAWWVTGGRTSPGSAG